MAERDERIRQRMPATERRLSQNQRHLLENVRRTSRQRADAVLSNANLTPEEMEALNLARRKITRRANLVINRNLRQDVFGEPVIDSLMRSERLYNQFELEYVQRDINPPQIRARLMSEFKIYGATPDIQLVLSRMTNTEHPNYAAVDYIGDPILFSSSAHYGAHRFRLGGRITERCTFTPADSFVVRRNQVFVYEDINGVLATKVGYPPDYWFNFINRNEEPFGPDGSVSYIEAQILGGVFDRDLISLYYPETDYFDDEFFAKLRLLAERFGLALHPY